MDGQDEWDDHDLFGKILNGIAWAICSTYHTMLGATLGWIVFGWDMLFDLPFIHDMEKTHVWKQWLINKSNKRENACHIGHDYEIGDKVLIVKQGILCKIEAIKHGPYEIVKVFENGMVELQWGSMCECINIQWLEPFYSD